MILHVLPGATLGLCYVLQSPEHSLHHFLVAIGVTTCWLVMPAVSKRCSYRKSVLNRQQTQLAWTWSKLSTLLLQRMSIHRFVVLLQTTYGSNWMIQSTTLGISNPRAATLVYKRVPVYCFRSNWKKIVIHFTCFYRPCVSILTSTGISM